MLEINAERDKALSSTLGSHEATRDWKSSWLSRVTSTNAVLAEQVRSEPRHGLSILSDFQSRGRGRFDRRWVSEPGLGVAISVYLAGEAIGLESHDWTWLPMLSGLAVVRTLESLSSARQVETLETDRPTGIGRIVLKWPNDVLINDDKVAGILIERIQSQSHDGVIVGCGINLFHERHQLPTETSTSLQLAGLHVEPVDVARRYLVELAQLSRVASAGDVRSAYLRHSGTIDRLVRVHLGTGRVLEGIATDVNNRGELVIDSGGDTHTIAAGDVIHLRRR